MWKKRKKNYMSNKLSRASKISVNTDVDSLSQSSYQSPSSTRKSLLPSSMGVSTNRKSTYHHVGGDNDPTDIGLDEVLDELADSDDDDGDVDNKRKQSSMSTKSNPATGAAIGGDDNNSTKTIIKEEAKVIHDDCFETEMDEIWEYFLPKVNSKQAIEIWEWVLKSKNRFSCFFDHENGNNNGNDDDWMNLIGCGTEDEIPTLKPIPLPSSTQPPPPPPPPPPTLPAPSSSPVPATKSNVLSPSRTSSPSMKKLFPSPITTPPLLSSIFPKTSPIEQQNSVTSSSSSTTQEASILPNAPASNSITPISCSPYIEFVHKEAAVNLALVEFLNSGVKTKTNSVKSVIGKDDKSVSSDNGDIKGDNDNGHW
eukprot:CAMPEP_0114376962 /NCGR_PEP_ID=MMETSP0102-20121206/703_1 /TAXON_ID=38822 ORGANISM="Pteridomonas danica, Strain PT" /NCGR_SAMPLE_ID=MMETSP0102 /ASSEMBLY_ACC=CAM_ASM_000212 /LENGTH=367 /DNA_ID=CAMNT_0001531427 /DNA_START=128 /DNA_END=1228 /DNA_ORIENTATION=+